jgi:hypothetical protein
MIKENLFIYRKSIGHEIVNYTIWSEMPEVGEKNRSAQWNDIWKDESEERFIVAIDDEELKDLLPVFPGSITEVTFGSLHPRIQRFITRTLSLRKITREMEEYYWAAVKDLPEIPDEYELHVEKPGGDNTAGMIFPGTGPEDRLWWM